VSAGDRAPDRSRLSTEGVNERTRGLDLLPTTEALERMAREDESIQGAIRAAHPAIAEAIEAIAERLERGGRLFYVGAGTSGRLGVLDAVECPPTFQSDPLQIQGLLAGGPGAMFRSLEGAEDDPRAAGAELRGRECGAGDVVFGISAGGTTAYVHGALATGRELGALTIFLACVPSDQAPDRADLSIRVVTGPEVLQGSTRLKAGTATKLVLNSISTLVMAKLGKIFDNRMVDLCTAGNAKLLDRGLRLVVDLAGVDRARAREALDAASGRVKVAVLLLRRGLSPAAAEAELARRGGHLRQALVREGQGESSP